MVYCELNDQYCLDKIKSSFDYDLSTNLSFSDSNLVHLNRAFSSEKVTYKHKYLNCLRISAEVFRIRNWRLESKLRRNKRSKMNEFLDKNLSLTNLNDFDRSNLLACKDLSQSDPELYSAKLFSYLNTDTKQSQLFFIKTIYSTFRSLNFLKFFKPKKLKKEPDVDLISLSSYETLENFIDNDFSLESFEDESANLKDDSQIDKPIDLKDLKEMKPNFIDKLDDKIEQTNMHTIRLNQSLSNCNEKADKPNLVDLKEIKKEPTSYTQFLRLSFLDSFLGKHLPDTSHSESDRSKPEKTKEINDHCSNGESDANKNDQPNKVAIKLNTKRSIDEIETIDLNDVNNFEYYKDSFLGSFDLDIEEQEIINYDFDKKLEKFLKQDLKRLNRSKADSGKKKDQFDSVKCLNQFQSKIPVLKRDETKFSKPMLDKLKIEYDPLKIRKKSKELIEILDEDYKERMSKVSNKTNDKPKAPNKTNDQKKPVQFKSKIPRFIVDNESPKNHDTDLLISRKELALEATKVKKKGEKLFKLIKEISSPKDATKPEEYQPLKRCLPRTKSESFTNEQLDSNRINEGFREHLLNLELKTNGNCLFQLYDYFGDFKEKTKRT